MCLESVRVANSRRLSAVLTAAQFFAARLLAAHIGSEIMDSITVTPHPINEPAGSFAPGGDECERNRR
jgi:hypothetical protein